MRTAAGDRQQQQNAVEAGRGGYVLRRISLLWQGRTVALTKVLRGEKTGIPQVDHDVHKVHFDPARLSAPNSSRRSENQ